MSPQDDRARAPASAAMVPAPKYADLADRVREERLPVHRGRLAASVVAGVGGALFGLTTAALAFIAVRDGAAGKWSALMVTIPIIAFTGASTLGCGFLTWRWARSLPPSKTLALTEREREELE